LWKSIFFRLDTSSERLGFSKLTEPFVTGEPPRKYSKMEVVKEYSCWFGFSLVLSFNLKYLIDLNCYF
jgi:hypothetical protein